MRTDALDYDLPEGLIATSPAEPRDRARLMLCDRGTGEVAHHRVRDLPELGLFEPGDVMVVNQTRVLPALLTGTRAGTGGKVTGLYLGEVATLDRETNTASSERAAPVWHVMLESRGKLQPGEVIALDRQAQLTLTKKLDRGAWHAKLSAPVDAPDPPTPMFTAEVLARVGQTPLPPYIRQARRKAGLPEVGPDDLTRYNTLFSHENQGDPSHASGSVAAPTAGLHFTEDLLARLNGTGLTRHAITLHVGMGTFAPVRSDDLAQHTMHTEPYRVPAATLAALAEARRAGRTITAVGTTSVRTLESLPTDALELDPPRDVHGDTDLYIHPESGFEFRFTDRLMTNFHLPKSTLLALVASLPGVGLPRLLDWYRQAVIHEYRFYSYGDAMLIV